MIERNIAPKNKFLKQLQDLATKHNIVIYLMNVHQDLEKNIWIT